MIIFLLLAFSWPSSVMCYGLLQVAVQKRFCDSIQLSFKIDFGDFCGLSNVEASEEKTG
jgi:hypothetical protein